MSNFNRNWLFKLGDIKEAYEPEFNDSDWRTLNLPHDWSVEFPFEEKWEGCTGFLPGGIGWYRKHFDAPEDLTNKTVYIYFDGVYNHSTLYINGHELGYHPYGYSPFYHDIGSFLKESDNVLSLRVDHSRYGDSRWYTGSGIYRDVELIIRNKLHINIWGTFVRTPNNNRVEIDADIKNDYPGARDFTMEVSIYDGENKIVASQRDTFNITGESHKICGAELKVKNPRLWNIMDSHMYRAEVKIYLEDRLIETHNTPFGIRQFEFSTEKGFLLNGKKVLLKGSCLHHAAGMVGAAVPLDIWKRRLNELKACGCNAIRCSHNPPSRAFLDLCDHMGFFVQNEFFDEWDFPKDKRHNGHEREADYITEGYYRWFQGEGENDLKSAMLRDRNHPSIFQWSLGNEIELTYKRVLYTAGAANDADDAVSFDTEPTWTPEIVRETYGAIPTDDYDIGVTAEKLAAWTREMDTTRPVTANCCIPSVSYEAGFTDALDVVGYSYRRVIYDYAKRHYPDKPILGSENFTRWHEWKAVLDRDFVAGIFLWTGIDYMGETREWPSRGSRSGLLDFAGFRKPPFYMFKSLWSDEKTIKIFTQLLNKTEYLLVGEKLREKEENSWQHKQWGWQDMNEHFNYSAGDMVAVEIYSNCSDLELFLNGRSLGRQELKDLPDRIYKWAIPYEPGELKAVSISDGMEDKLTTAEEPVEIGLTADRDKISAYQTDCVHLIARLYDAKGNRVRHKEQEMEFSVSGPCRVLGVDNGSGFSVQPYRSNTLLSHVGKALMIIQATGDTGEIEIEVGTGASKSDTLKISVV